MKTKTMLMASAAALVFAATAGAANAGHFHGWYISVEGGASWVQDWDFTSNLGPAHIHDDVASFDTGWAAMASLGYSFQNNWRVELEAGYRSNDIDVIDTGLYGGVYTSPDAGLDEFTLMANVLYDIPLSKNVSLSLGAGVGADKVDLEFGRNPAADVDEWTFAYQGIAGLNVALSSRTDVFVNYRYLNVNAVDLPIGPIQGHLPTGTEDFQKHTVTIGLRYDLAPDEVAAPPPPPPPPPVSAPKEFLVFFGFNKCNITGEADAVLSEAASAAKTYGSASVSVVGHTDTVGSNGYNQKLSECRANAAKSNLVGKGIPASAISASGRGEGDLIVQTGDNVKEPQNRRASITLN